FACGALALGALYWSIAGDVHMGWLALKSSYIRYAAPNHSGANSGGAQKERGPLGTDHLTVQRAAFKRYGLDSTVAAPDEWGRLIGGNVVSSSHDYDAAPIRLAICLGLALCEEPAKIGVVTPALDETKEAVRLLAPQASVEVLRPGGPYAPRIDRHEVQAPDLIFCGPGALSARRNPNCILSVEGLEELKAALGSHGVLTLWLPTRSQSVAELRRALATVAQVFEHFFLFVSLDELVLLCGGTARLSYPTLRSFFE
ncbi:unnamed protein product, partial [marine sediment metagenome]